MNELVTVAYWYGFISVGIIVLLSVAIPIAIRHGLEIPNGWSHARAAFLVSVLWPIIVVFMVAMVLIGEKLQDQFFAWIESDEDEET